MKFRFLLWMLGRLMAKASRTNPEFQQQLAGKDLGKLAGGQGIQAVLRMQDHCQAIDGDHLLGRRAGEVTQ